jgi:Fe-S cluster assembly scaffold protein SufB
MSVGCVAVDSHNCLQTAQKKYLKHFAYFNWAVIIDSVNIAQINSLLDHKVLIYLKKNEQLRINSTLRPYNDIYIILEQNSNLDIQVSLTDCSKNIAVLLPEPGASINLKIQSQTISNLQLNILCDQLAPNTNVNIHGRFFAYHNAKLTINGKIIMHELSTNSSSKLIFKCLRESNQSEIKLSPELEVYNSLVKANHGSAVDIIDQRLLWQLMARGISKKNAQVIFKKSFLKDDQCI